MITKLELYFSNGKAVYMVGSDGLSEMGNKCTDIQEVQNGYSVNFKNGERHKILNISCIAIYKGG